MDEAQGARLAHLLVEQAGEFLIFQEWRVLARLAVLHLDLTVLACDLLVLFLYFRTDGITRRRAVDRPSRIGSRYQDPSAVEATFDPLEFRFGTGFDHDVATLYALRTRGVRWCREMKCHSVLAQKTPEPWPTVETDRYGSRLLQFYIQSPFLVLMDHPFCRVLISVRTDEPATKPIGQDIQLVHDLIVGLADFDDFLDGGILRVRRNKI